MSVAQTEGRIKAVAGISSVDIGAFIREGLGPKTPVEIQLETLKAVSRQRTTQARGAEPMYVPWAPCCAEQIDASTPVLLREAYDYYRTPRAQHERSQNKMLFTSIDRLMAFSAFDRIGMLLHKPLLLIAGAAADTLHFSREAYELANEPKELFLVEGATHIDLYDRPEYTEPVVAKVTAFFRKNL